MVYLRAVTPKRNVIFEIAGAVQHGPGNDPVDVDQAAFDIFKEAVIGGWFPTDVVVLWKAIDGYSNPQTLIIHPFHWNRDYAAGHDEGMNAAAIKLREDTAQFAVPHQRFSTDE
jgi:hypothetical protein